MIQVVRLFNLCYVHKGLQYGTTVYPGAERELEKLFDQIDKGEVISI
ncbi:MAG TPA: hypothetical protein VGJ84_19690 [Polyangiaceae bacterium]